MRLLCDSRLFGTKIHFLNSNKWKHSVQYRKPCNISHAAWQRAKCIHPPKCRKIVKTKSLQVISGFSYSYSIAMKIIVHICELKIDAKNFMHVCLCVCGHTFASKTTVRSFVFRLRAAFVLCCICLIFHREGNPTESWNWNCNQNHMTNTAKWFGFVLPLYRFLLMLSF